jgi:hypothetical protein
MKRLLRQSRVSPAMVVALFALFVALSGTALATSAARITGADVKNNSLTGLDVKNKSLTPKDFRGSVRGPRGLPGSPGQPGAKGDPGAPGAAGTARAHAVVTAGAAFVTPYTKNFTAVQRTATGVYCLTAAAGIDRFTSPAVVSPDYWASAGSDLRAYAAYFASCPQASQYEVRTYTGNPPVLSNSVGFSIIVP